MPLSFAEIQAIASATAWEVLERVHRYPVAYQEPDSVEDGLRESMSEELTAADWYRRRAASARKVHDEATASLYEEIAGDEENDHYARFNARLQALTEKQSKAAPAEGLRRLAREVGTTIAYQRMHPGEKEG